MSKHLLQTERQELALLREKWYSFREIWEMIGKDHTALSREMRRNQVKWSYDARKAQVKSYQRRHSCKRQTKKIRKDDELEMYTKKWLLAMKSPEQIAGRRNVENPTRKISSSSVRRYVETPFCIQTRYLVQLERRKKKYRKRNKKENGTRQVIQHRVFIDARPLYISKPSRPWHYECDLIMSVKTEKDCVLTLIDKFTRCKIAIKLASKDSIIIEKILMKIIKKYQILSITFDNDLAFAQHYKLWILTYFCHTYSSREKWQVERGNRDYRKYFPKWTELSTITQKRLDQITHELNADPLRCLNYHTPYEVMVIYKKSLVQKLIGKDWYMAWEKDKLKQQVAKATCCSSVLGYISSNISVTNCKSKRIDIRPR